MTKAARDARNATLALLARRAPGATICPSEVARALVADVGGSPARDDWRETMPVVHEAVDRLMIDGLVRLSWKWEALTMRDGPYRIGVAGRDDSDD